MFLQRTNDVEVALPPGEAHLITEGTPVSITVGSRILGTMTLLVCSWSMGATATFGEESFKSNPARQVQETKTVSADWRIGKKALLDDLGVLSRDPAYGPVARKYLEEVNATNETLTRAKGLANRREKDLKRLSEVTAKLERHRKRLKVLQNELNQVGRENDDIRGKRQLSSEKLQRAIRDVDTEQTRARNEADKIKGHFQAWQEKASQVDQQLSAVLRTMKDVRRIGVGGSDLGSS